LGLNSDTILGKYFIPIETHVYLFESFLDDSHPQLKAGGFKLSAESTDTGRKTRLSFFHFHSFMWSWIKMMLKITLYYFVVNLAQNKQLTADDSFLKTFFKTLKEGRKTGAIANIFITGVLPVTMDELASTYNIANFITLDASFENMLGFTQTEVNGLLDSICRDYDISPPQRREIEAIIINHYNGYHFVSSDAEAVFRQGISSHILLLSGDADHSGRFLFKIAQPEHAPDIRRVF
jgi:hypothetical protein